MPQRQRLRILQLLDQHGELTAAAVRNLDRGLPRGTIYTTLRRLAHAKLVTSRVERTGQPGPPRRFHRITRRGRRYYQTATQLAQITGA
jgi:DNA-binding PadR family transcriptional regulator